MAWLADTIGLSEAITTKLVVSLSTILGLIVIRWGILALVHRRIKEQQVWYWARKVGSYLVFFISLLVLLRVWLIDFGNLATFLGLLSAGVAIGLADVLKNLAGWVYVLTRRPFRVGDRVEIDGRAGDIVDIRIFRFSLLEIGNWVDADQSTGRILHIPNGLLFTQPIANFTEGFEFLWHEVPVLITFESDWHRGEELLRRVLAGAAPGVHRRAADRLRATARQYNIRYTHLEPTVYVKVLDSGVLLTGRLLVPVRSRREIDQVIWRALLDGLAAEPSVQLAYPTVRTYLSGPITVEQPPPT